MLLAVGVPKHQEYLILHIVIGQYAADDHAGQKKGMQPKLSGVYAGVFFFAFFPIFQAYKRSMKLA